MYIVVEGLEGAGKTTQLKLIQEYVENVVGKSNVIIVREPGGTEIAEQLRNIVKYEKVETITDDTELLLFYAARSQLRNNVIIPALELGKVVISDRNELSTKAYQGAGRGLKEQCEVLNNMVIKSHYPDLIIYMDIDPEIGLSRARGRDTLDRMESNDLDFFKRARDCYLTEAANNENMVVIDASGPIGEIWHSIHAILSAKIEGKS